MTPPPADRLVALRALGLGDFLTAVPALRGLARAYPHATRLLAAPAWLRPLVAAANIGFDVVDVSLKQELTDVPQLPAALSGADVAVNLHGRGPQSTLALQALDAARLLAFDVAGGPGWDAGAEHEVQRWCRLLRWYGIDCDPAELDLTVDASGVAEADREAVIVHPGTADPARRWPAPRWGEVARRLREAGHHVLLTGTAEELALAQDVASAAGLPLSSVRAGQTTLGELAALTAAASVVLAADTGVGHLATAVGTPSVLVFGPVSPHVWGPPPERRQHVVLWAGDREHAAGVAPDDALQRISADDVLAATAALLESLR